MRIVTRTLGPFLFMALVAYDVTGGGMMFGVLGSRSGGSERCQPPATRDPIQPSQPERPGEMVNNPFVP